MTRMRFTARPACPSAERGFTLIELLVSLALMGMAATLLLQGLVTAGLIARRERATTIGMDEIIAAQRILRGSIERLRPVTRSDSLNPVVEFRGTTAVVTFVGAPLGRAAPDALQRFRLTRTSTGDLVLYSASTRKAGIERDGTDLTGWTPNTLLRGVRDLSIGYLGESGPDRERGWRDRWWDQPRPPELVRIRVAFGEGDRRTWPDLVIRPRAATNVVCRTDPLTGRCEEQQ